MAASVVRLGLKPNGTLQVPTDYSTTGWWSGGPFPGEPGPAVIVGHVDSRLGPAVFSRLRQLRRGDEVLVTHPDRTVVRFIVDRLIQVPKQSFPTKQVYGATRGSTLRLITCGGAFDSSVRHYTDNVIVFAHLGGST